MSVDSRPLPATWCATNDCGECDVCGLVEEVERLTEFETPLRELAGYVRAHLRGQDADPELRYALQLADEALRNPECLTGPLVAPQPEGAR